MPPFALRSYVELEEFEEFVQGWNELVLFAIHARFEDLQYPPDSQLESPMPLLIKSVCWRWRLQGLLLVLRRMESHQQEICQEI